VNAKAAAVDTYAHPEVSTEYQDEVYGKLSTRKTEEISVKTF
jgi:hypothetical protein